MNFLSTSSSIAIALAGILIMICWFIAIDDTASKGGGHRGCIERLHETRGYADLIPSKCFTEELNSHYGLHEDIYILCRICSAVCGILWIITGLTVCISRTIYLLAGIGSSIAFLIVFAVVIERTRYNHQCELYTELMHCLYGSTKYELVWYTFTSNSAVAMKNMYNSYELIWGSSLACIIVGVYQIICAIVLVYRERKKYTKSIELGESERLQNMQTQPMFTRIEVNNIIENKAQQEAQIPKCAEVENEEGRTEILVVAPISLELITQDFDVERIHEDSD